MKYEGVIKKSRTYDYAALVGIFGAIQQTLPGVQEQLGEYYGWVFMAVAAGIAFYRHKTTTPVGAKLIVN